MKKKKSYVAAPRVSEAIQERYRAVLQVLSGEISVSEAARQTGLSRNHFQTLMHRGLEGLIAELTPKAPGRPRAQDPGLLEKNERLEKEVKRLQGRVEMIDRMLGVASDLLKGRAPLGRPRQKKTASTKSKTPTPDDEEPRRRLQEAVRMRQQG